MNFFSGEEVSYEAKRQKRIEHNWNKISKARGMCVLTIYKCNYNIHKIIGNMHCSGSIEYCGVLSGITLDTPPCSHHEVLS